MSIVFMHLETTDAICFVRNDSDNTKRLRFDLNSAITDTTLILQASQTADRTITFPDITGTLMTDNSSDTFLNKTITDNSNYVGANELKTTGASVVISGSAPPTTGQILKATSPTTATWEDETGGGGEVNTASNVGTAGVGVFKQKTGTNLEFKKINTANSSNITITDDTGNDEVDINIGSSVATLTGTQTLTNKTLTDSSNNITANGLRTATTTVSVSGATAPSAGQVLKATSSTNASWSAQTLYFQAYLNVQTTFATSATDLPLNVEVVKNSPYTHTTNSPEVSITVSGNYIITVYASPYGTAGTSRSSAEIWLSLNTGSGFTEVAGTRGVAYVRQALFGSCISFERYLTLNAGDIVKVQAQRTEGTTTSVIRSGQYSMLIKSA